MIFDDGNDYVGFNNTSGLYFKTHPVKFEWKFLFKNILNIEKILINKSSFLQFYLLVVKTILFHLVPSKHWKKHFVLCKSCCLLKRKQLLPDKILPPTPNFSFWGNCSSIFCILTRVKSFIHSFIRLTLIVEGPCGSCHSGCQLCRHAARGGWRDGMAPSLSS